VITDIEGRFRSDDRKILGAIHGLGVGEECFDLLRSDLPELTAGVPEMSG
jgi:hypothetical protein